MIISMKNSSNFSANLPARASQDVNPASFPCAAGKAPSIGFSHYNNAGQAKTDGIVFSPEDVLNNDAQLAVYSSLYGSCVDAKTSFPKVVALMNCAPQGYVQACSNLYICNDSRSINGTAFKNATAQTLGGLVTATFIGSSAVVNDTVAGCFLDNLQGALNQAVTQYPNLKGGTGKISGDNQPSSSNPGAGTGGSSKASSARKTIKPNVGGAKKLSTVLAIFVAASFVAQAAV